MLLEVFLDDIMVKLSPKIYPKCGTMISKGKPLLYAHIQKALYGVLQSVLLLYIKLLKELEAHGFQINSYNPCVANKPINKNKMTAVWHADGLNVSHMKSFKITKISKYLSRIYGGLVVHREKVHNYLGTEFDYSDKGTVRLYMVRYLNRIIKEPPDNLETTEATMDSEHLCKVNNDIEEQ